MIQCLDYVKIYPIIVKSYETVLILDFFRMIELMKKLDLLKPTFEHRTVL